MLLGAALRSAASARIARTAVVILAVGRTITEALIGAIFKRISIANDLNSAVNPRRLEKRYLRVVQIDILRTAQAGPDVSLRYAEG